MNQEVEHADVMSASVASSTSKLSVSNFPLNLCMSGNKTASTTVLDSAKESVSDDSNVASDEAVSENPELESTRIEESETTDLGQKNTKICYGIKPLEYEDGSFLESLPVAKRLRSGNPPFSDNISPTVRDSSDNVVDKEALKAKCPIGNNACVSKMKTLDVSSCVHDNHCDPATSVSVSMCDLCRKEKDFLIEKPGHSTIMKQNLSDSSGSIFINDFCQEEKDFLSIKSGHSTILKGNTSVSSELQESCNTVLVNTAAPEKRDDNSDVEILYVSDNLSKGTGGFKQEAKPCGNPTGNVCNGQKKTAECNTGGAVHGEVAIPRSNLCGIETKKVCSDIKQTAKYSSGAVVSGEGVVQASQSSVSCVKNVSAPDQRKHPIIDRSALSRLKQLVTTNENTARKENKETLTENSSQAPAKPADAEPFNSDDPSENFDNNNPEWEKFKVLETDKERYRAVQLLWKSRRAPDPNRDLTTFNYRRRVLGIDKNVPFQTPLPANRKRPLSGSSRKGPPSKRLHSITEIFHMKHKNIIQKRDQDLQKVHYKFVAEIEKVQADFGEMNYQMQSQGFDRSKVYTFGDPRNDKYNFWKPWERYHDELRKQEDWLHQRRVAEERTIKERYHKEYTKTQKSLEETTTFFKFFNGLSPNDPMVVPRRQYQEQLAIDEMLRMYELWYGPVEN